MPQAQCSAVPRRGGHGAGKANAKRVCHTLRIAGWYAWPRPASAIPASAHAPRGDTMRRRDAIALLAGAAAVSPLSATAQQPGRVRRLGVLMSLTADDRESQVRL